MAKAPTIPTVDDFLAVQSGNEQFMLDMLGSDLSNAVVNTRIRLQDASVMCRIGENPLGPGGDYPPGFVPGLVSIHRDGADTIHGLSHDDALRMVGELV